MKAYERLLKYVVVRTPSDENSNLSARHRTVAFTVSIT